MDKVQAELEKLALKGFHELVNPRKNKNVEVVYQYPKNFLSLAFYLSTSECDVSIILSEELYERSKNYSIY